MRRLYPLTSALKIAVSLRLTSSVVMESPQRLVGRLVKPYIWQESTNFGRKYQQELLITMKERIEGQNSKITLRRGS